MYSVDEQDRVKELSRVPQASAGAPMPVVLADEQRLLLAYLAAERHADWSAPPASVGDSPAQGESVVLVEFEGHRAYMHGPPNDEALRGHPLAPRGLTQYGVFEVERSSWVRRLEQMNRVHPGHDPARYERLRHFIFTFHDSTFECVAEDLTASVRVAPLGAFISEMAQRLVQRDDG